MVMSLPQQAATQRVVNPLLYRLSYQSVTHTRTIQPLCEAAHYTDNRINDKPEPCELMKNAFYLRLGSSIRLMSCWCSMKWCLDWN